MVRLVTADFPNNAEPCVLRYTTVDNTMLYIKADAFDAEIISHTYINGEGAIIFKAPVLSIRDSAFRFNGNLKSIICPNTIEWIGQFAFGWCHSLQSINIPNSVKTICKEAFGGCGNLTSITIPESVITIEGGAFDGCNGELIIHSKIIEKDYNYISYPARHSCDYQDWGGWLNNSNFTKVIIGDNIRKIGAYSFHEYNPLSEIIIPDNVQIVGYAAFYNCCNLIKISLGCGINRIEGGAFAHCDKLETIICKAITPPKLDCNALSSIPENTSIVIQKICQDSYINSEWSKPFYNIDIHKEIEMEIACELECTNNDNEDYNEHSYGKYRGSYAQDIAGYSDEEINDIFDGCPNAYWNID